MPITWLWDWTAPATDRGGEIQPRIEHGLNTDRVQARRKLVPPGYGDGGTRAMALEHEEITEQIVGAAFEVYSMSSEQFPTDGPTSHDHWGVSIRVQSVFNPWLELHFATAITNRHGVSRASRTGQPSCAFSPNAGDSTARRSDRCNWLAFIRTNRVLRLGNSHASRRRKNDIAR